MAKISSARNFQYKLVKSVVLSILIPAAIILFSAWFFFGGVQGKLANPVTTTTITTKSESNNTDLCKGMKKDTCNADTCIWDSKKNMCLASK
jgi:hypothetical protein